MTSKWIEELSDAIEENDFSAIKIIVDRVDDLLFQAMLSVENQELSDKISEEINNGED